MGVNPKIGVFTPQIIHFNKVFHYKPSILGYPYIFGNIHLAKISEIVVGDLIYVIEYVLRGL